MTVVPQINDYACYLACLESFLRDFGRAVTQQTIIEDFKVECHHGLPNEGEFDFTPANNAQLQAKYGFKIAFRTVDFDDLRPGDFIGAERIKDQNCHHIVRFLQYEDKTAITVMCPRIGGFERWSRDEFLRYKCYVFNVSLNAV